MIRPTPSQKILLGFLAKHVGEGSRGGHIVGHTKTGTAIYAHTGGLRAKVPSPHKGSVLQHPAAQAQRKIRQSGQRPGGRLVNGYERSHIARMMQDHFPNDGAGKHIKMAHQHESDRAKLSMPGENQPEHVRAARQAHTDAANFHWGAAGLILRAQGKAPDW